MTLSDAYHGPTEEAHSSNPGGSTSFSPPVASSSAVGSPDTVYYSLSSVSEGEDLAPDPRELERQWLAKEKAKVDKLKKAAENATFGSRTVTRKRYEDYKKTDRYREYQSRRRAFNESAPSRHSAPVSEIGPLDSRSSHSSPPGLGGGESHGYGWQPATTRLTEFEALQAKYGYPPAETNVQQAMQAIIMYTNEWAAKGIDATRLPPAFREFLAENWAKVPKAVIDNISTVVTTMDAANAGSTTRLATAVNYLAHATQAYQSSAAIANFMESTAQGRFVRDLANNSSQAAGVGFDYATMYTQQPMVGLASATFKGFVQPGARAVTEVTEHLHNTHLEQRNARRDATGGDANPYAGTSNIQSPGIQTVSGGYGQGGSTSITVPPRAKSPARR